MIRDYKCDKAADSNDRLKPSINIKLFHYCSKTLQVVMNVARVQCFFSSDPVVALNQSFKTRPI